MFATQVLSEDLSESINNQDDDVEIVGFIIVKNSKYEIKKGETKIGRDPSECSVVIENFTISKIHAIIESEGIDDTFIYDAGSTNQTKLGKKTLKPHCRYKLENNNSITFGNIIAKFILPFEVRENSESQSSLENFKVSSGPDDIFDVVTQITVPHLQTSVKITQFAKEPESCQIFKVPEFVDSGEKVKRSLKSSKDFIQVKECQLESQDLVSRTEFNNGSCDTSGIFSLPTQCQITQSSSKENKSEHKIISNDHRNNEDDLLKSFLCDGQDGVLCTFMSLHCPDEQKSSKLPEEIKTEIIQENDTQLFDVPTQVQTLLVQANTNTGDAQLNEDFQNQNSPKPKTCSSLPVNGSQLNPTSSDIERFSTSDSEEDFVKTQQFNSDPASDGTTLPSDSVTANKSQESDTECHSEKTLDLSTAEGPSENEDFICTQKYEVLNRSLQKTTGNTPENEKLNESNEDFMETQLFDSEWEQNNKKFENEIVNNPDGAPFVVSESPEKDTETFIEGSTDFTQRNVEEDYIGTQAFNEIADISSSESSERDDENCNDEDFISTQRVDFLLNSPVKNKSQECISIQTASGETSPDLLDSGFSVQASIDCIKKSSQNPTSEFSEKVHSILLTSVKTELNEDLNLNKKRSIERIESSGEETDSDLEIIFAKNETSKKIMRIEEFSPKSVRVESQQPEDNAVNRSSGAHENNDSNSSYIFQLDREAHEEVATDTVPSKQNILLHRDRTAGSDSDETDCEDIVVNRETALQQQHPEKISFDENQVPTPPPANNFAQQSSDDDGTNDKESPTFEIGQENDCWGELSLEMPSTQDMESTISKVLCNKSDAEAQDSNPKNEDHRKSPNILNIEVKTNGSNSIQSEVKGKIDCPLKRQGNSSSETEAVPSKKSKIEISDRKLRSSDRQLLKLWQAHSFAQIQPSRTRSSLKNGVVENKSNKTDVSLRNNISNKFATSRRETSARRKTARKLSFEITPYLCKKVENNKRTFLEGGKKETPPKENRVETKPVECCPRVLRSSTRNSGNILPSESLEYSTRQGLTRSTRNSRFKKEDRFGNPCVNIVFTGFDSDSLKKIISGLGGKKTDDLSSGDVVVSDKVRRTVKFLSAIALSLPITSPEWLLACKAENKFLNPWNFILKDEESERKWGFDLKASLQRSKNVKLMEGLSVFATANAKPPVKDLMAIVKYCGGTPLFEPPSIWPRKTVIVSCPEDKKWWPLPKFRNIKIVHYEFILIGVMRQKLDFKTYKLR